MKVLAAEQHYANAASALAKAHAETAEVSMIRTNYILEAMAESLQGLLRAETARAEFR